MNVDLGIWDRLKKALKKAIVCLLVLAVLLGVGRAYLPNIKRNEDFRRKIVTAQAELAREVELNRQLRGTLDSLKDPQVIERLARERLAYSRPDGEKVVKFITPPTK